ncbi:hypothetical protein F4810DRAFT_708018 [Camillea tinctor]|nr:hypothetical protein F4810DRAFT_708018 [Camillea tinctor]
MIPVLLVPAVLAACHNSRRFLSASTAPPALVECLDTFGIARRVYGLEIGRNSGNATVYLVRLLIALCHLTQEEKDIPPVSLASAVSADCHSRRIEVGFTTYDTADRYFGARRALAAPKQRCRLAPPYTRDSSPPSLEGGVASGGRGHGKVKAGYIKSILDMVHQENAERRAACIAEKETGVEAKVYGASEKTNSQKGLEILETEKDILSLDHMRGLSIGEAMKQFTKRHGVGVRTSACVLLSCLQQPCSAVDTHGLFGLTSITGWNSLGTRWFVLVRRQAVWCPSAAFLTDWGSVRFLWNPDLEGQQTTRSAT